MKRITNVFLCVIMVIAVGFSAFAVPSLDESASYCQGGRFTVSGTADTGELLLLRAIVPNGSDADPGDIFYAETKFADQNGGFVFEFGINAGQTGDYKMIVTSANASSDEAIVRGINEADIISSISLINSAADALAVKSAFEDSDAAVKLNMDTSIYDRINSDADYATTFGIIYTALFEQKNLTPLSYNGTDVVNLNNLQTELDKSGALAYLNQENSLSAIVEFDTADKFNLTRAATPSDTLANYVTDKAAVKTSVASADYLSISALQRAYDEKMILAAIKNNDHFQINSIVNAAGVSMVLGSLFDAATYNANPSIQYGVDVAVAGNDYATLGEFITAFNTAVTLYMSQPYIPPQQGGVSSGSGSSSGGSVGVGGGAVVNPPYIDTSFYDLADYAWAKEAIDFLQGMEIISGTAPNTFSPADYVTREQFVKMLVLLLNKYNPSAVCTFADVPRGDWSASYIASAVIAGLIKGIDDLNFGYGMEISRQDACVLLARVIGDVLSDTGEAEFTDSDKISDYARESVLYLSSLGIINGMDTGEFAPMESMTRAQAAKVLYELYKTGGFADEN